MEDAKDLCESNELDQTERWNAESLVNDPWQISPRRNNFLFFLVAELDDVDRNDEQHYHNDQANNRAESFVHVILLIILHCLLHEVEEQVHEC